MKSRLLQTRRQGLQSSLLPSELLFYVCATACAQHSRIQVESHVCILNGCIGPRGITGVLSASPLNRDFAYLCLRAVFTWALP